MEDMPEMMIAGPGEMHPEDLAIMGEQLIAHYGDTWVAIHNETIDLLARLLGADAPYLMPGTGTTCLDAAFMNLFEPGQTVVVANTGFFGARLVEVAAAQRLNVIEVPVAIGTPADPAARGDAARASGAAGVLLTHVDTSTGTRHPIEETARATHDAGAILLVDGIASVGGELCDVDAMGIDALVTSTQKGMEAPPGLGVIALGAGGRARIAARSEPVPSWYYDLARWDWYRSDWKHHPHPVTFPSPPTLALRSSLKRILDVGLETWVARRAQLAQHTRDGLVSLGLEPVAQPGAQANMVVAAYTDDAAAIVASVLTQGIQISGGLAPLAGKTIRIGLMGRTATGTMVDRVLDAIARARKE